MTAKELQGLVEQLAEETVIQSKQQNIINRLLTEGMQRTSDQIQALLVVVQDHEKRLRDRE